MRISFLPGKDGPLQMIRSDGTANFRFRELSAVGRPAGGRGGDRPGDISASHSISCRGPLYRVELLRRAPDDHVMVFAIHHAIADGWTLGVFVQELCMAYIQHVRGNREAAPAVPLILHGVGRSGTGLLATERARVARALLEDRTWRAHRRCGGAWKVLRPAAGAAPTARRTISGGRWPGSARELARRSGATLFSTLLAVFQVALARWTGADDILVGSPVANRTQASAKETMGYFAGSRAHCAAGWRRSVTFFAESAPDAPDDGRLLRATPCPSPKLARAARRRGRAGTQPALRSPVCPAESSHTGRGVAGPFGKVADALDRDSPVPSGVRNHGRRRRARSGLALPARNSFRQAEVENWGACLPECCCQRLPAAGNPHHRSQLRIDTMTDTLP